MMPHGCARRSPSAVEGVFIRTAATQIQDNPRALPDGQFAVESAIITAFQRDPAEV